jgi:GR25 family glycosyltransferase involved in LPS biosynthesis
MVNTIKTLIINLKSRTDRKEQVINEVKKLNFIKDYEIVDGIENKNPKIGCTLSHQLCIKMAKDWKLPYILILEDDAIFENDINEVFLKSWDSLQQYDWKVFYLGAHLRHPSLKINDNLIEVKYPLTTHAYIIHESFYDTILQGSINVIIDRQLAALSYENKMYMCSPMVAFQRQSYSNLQNRVVDYKEDVLASFKAHVK